MACVMARAKKSSKSASSASDSVRTWLEERLAAIPNVRVPRLFGSFGIFSGKTMFGVLDEGRVYFKTDETTRRAYVERGAAVLTARKGTVDTDYYEVPAGVLEDEGVTEDSCV
jgi:TfoX/Sxy family transcriptional regulator of competence genes